MRKSLYLCMYVCTIMYVSVCVCSNTSSMCSSHSLNSMMDSHEQPASNSKTLEEYATTTQHERNTNLQELRTLPNTLLVIALSTQG